MSHAFDDYYIMDCGVISAPKVMQRRTDSNDQFVILPTVGVAFCAGGGGAIHGAGGRGAAGRRGRPCGGAAAAAPRAVRGGASGLAVLRTYPFRVPARGVLPLAYVARAQGAPLGDAGSAAMEAALRDGVVPFRVDGEAQTRWKVAGIVGVDQWTRLACQLRFFWPNGTVLPFRCISKSKFLFF
ncbi:late embryogenesis abundant protein [Zea mays]|uniref:Late embryogenesis abundant protein n=2 Tax=Zea mays TaxID=4577 RepID=A0A1D6HFV6_MAIZE|nr:late embryogenesis abundant protein [Zea mays]